jgi:hypothetical protein
MFRFTIRDVFWLMAVVGLVISLWWQYSAAKLWRSQSQQWESRANSAASALNAADRQNAWHGSNVVVVEPNGGVPIQRVYVPAK